MPYQIASPDLRIGKGIVLIAKHASDEPTAPANGYRDIGNAPGLALSAEVESIEHYSSRGGIKTKDDEQTTSTTYNGTITIDSMSMDNLAMFFLGSNGPVTQASATGKTQVFTGIKLDHTYQLGQTSVNPTGDRNVTITAMTLAAAPNTALVAGTHYELDAVRGTIRILPGTGLFVGGHQDTGFTVTYNAAASTRRQVISGETEFVGSLRFLANNPKGEDVDYFFPNVKLRPNGDHQLISDEYMQIEFQFEALTLGNYKAVYIDGQPVV